MAQDAVTDAPESETGDGVRRRDFINIAAVSAAGVGGLATLVPLISQMSPSADVLAESSTEVDISPIERGQAIKAVFRNQPVFVRNLTDKEIAEAGVTIEPDARATLVGLLGADRAASRNEIRKLCLYAQSAGTITTARPVATALPATAHHGSRNPVSAAAPTLSIRASTTPSAAPVLTPRIPGSARGLRVRPCIIAPAIASEAPTSAATAARGMRSVRIIR